MMSRDGGGQKYFLQIFLKNNICWEISLPKKYCQWYRIWMPTWIPHSSTRTPCTMLQNSWDISVLFTLPCMLTFISWLALRLCAIMPPLPGISVVWAIMWYQTLYINQQHWTRGLWGFKWIEKSSKMFRCKSECPNKFCNIVCAPNK